MFKTGFWLRQPLTGIKKVTMNGNKSNIGQLLLAWLICYFFIRCESRNCPNKCRCSVVIGLKYFECSYLNVRLLEKLADKLPNDTGILALAYFNLNEIYPKLELFSRLQNLTHVFFKSNSLIRMPPRVCEYFPNLEYLYIVHNNLRTVKKNDFLGCNLILGLKIYSNKNSLYVEKDAFTLLPKLKHLHLFKNNNLTFQSKVKFIGLKSVIDVNLINNNLKSIPVQLISELFSTEKINLSGNKITEIPQNLLHYLMNITEINLSNNELTQLPNYFVSNLRKIQLLNLESNKISNLTNVFANMKNTRNVDILLGNNPIKLLHNSDFENSSNLEIKGFNFSLINDCRIIQNLNQITQKHKNISISNDESPPTGYTYYVEKVLSKLNCTTCSIHTCDNGGVCTELNKDSNFYDELINQDDFTCNCDQRISYGKYCHIKYPQCHQRKCQNQGICHNEDENNFKCHCKDEFQGEYCEIQKSSSQNPKSNKKRKFIIIYISVAVSVFVLIMLAVIAISFKRWHDRRRHFRENGNSVNASEVWKNNNTQKFPKDAAVDSRST